MEIDVLFEGVHNDLGPINGTSIINSINPICSSVILLKGQNEVLVDTGFRGFDKEIIDGLDKKGLKPDDIDIVVNTHSHFDHCYNNYLFKNAKVIFGHSILYSKKWDVFSTIEIPCITIIKTPGHYPDHISVVVKNDETYVLAGDALREDIVRNDITWRAMNENYIKNARYIFSIADVIIPGHGRVIQGELLEELRAIINTR